MFGTVIMQAHVAVLALLVLSGSNRLSAAESYLGKYAFNWHIDPDTTKCKTVDNQLNARLNSPQFTCHRTKQTATQVPATECTTKDEQIGYLLFSSMKLCENERLTQAANGP